jgi:hypothetical protein
MGSFVQLDERATRLQKVIELINTLFRERYWGKVIITWESGSPVHVERRISEKIEP